MKRLYPLVMLIAVALLGCNGDAPDAPKAEGKSDPTNVQDKSTAAPAQKTAVPFKAETGSLLTAEDVPLLEQINRENVRVLAATMPAIVRIMAARPVDPRTQLFNGQIPFQFHFGPGAPHIPLEDPSYGSGVVISKNGYVVTNAHVIEDSNDVEVELQDKRSFTAQVVASDTPMDIAVLKIDASDLTPLPWGDSDKVRVGEQVFAIGNPFNLEDSASKGIVSAMRRNLPDSPAGPHYEDYIQTDAAINPGNSGGALINIHGELIGINTAIASTSRGNMGVGFAIPSNLARYAVEGLLRDGRLVRGYLGVRLPNSIDDGVTDLLGLAKSRGALLAGVQHSSPADQAKLHAVDFITEVDGHKIDGVANLRLVVAQIPIGKEVVVNYIRAGTPQSTTVKVVEAPKSGEQDVSLSVPGTDDAGAPVSTVTKGTFPSVDNVLNDLQVSDLNDKSRQKFGIDGAVTSGVVITDVVAGSVADAKGLFPGDVIEIVSPSRTSILTIVAPKDYGDIVKSLKPDQGVVLLVQHGKSSNFVYLAPLPK